MNDRTPILYLNENIPIRLVDILSRSGIVAIHTVDVSRQGTTDESQLEYAANQNYILVSHDRHDFRELHARWVREDRVHNGILVMNQSEPEYLAERIGYFLDYVYPTLTAPFCVSPPTLADSQTMAPPSEEQ